MCVWIDGVRDNVGKTLKKIKREVGKSKREVGISTLFKSLGLDVLEDSRAHS